MIQRTIFCALMLLSLLCTAQSPSDKAGIFITDRLNQCHYVTFVYKEGNFGGNYFIPLVEGDTAAFTKITQQDTLFPSSGRSHGRLVFDPSKALDKGYSAWRYTYGPDNFGQFKGLNMEGGTTLVFMIRGKGVIELVAGGTNRPPFKSPNPNWFEDGLDVRGTGYITLQDTGWTKIELNLLDSTFWVNKGPRQGANNRFPVVGIHENEYTCSEYFRVVMDSVDEMQHPCIAINWTKPSNAPNPTCYGGVSFLAPNINPMEWQLATSQGYNCDGIESVRFKAKSTKPGLGKFSFNSNSINTPGGEQICLFQIDTIWKWYSMDSFPTAHFTRVISGFGVALGGGLPIPDSVTLYLDSILYKGVSLKTDLSQLITGANIIFPKVHNPEIAWVAFDSIYIDRPRLDEPRTPQSFVLPRLGNYHEDTLFQTQQNTAHVYDAALACIERLHRWHDSNDPIYLQQAKHIGDFFVFAQNHDRTFQDGRLRNVYASGAYRDYDGLVRMPGYWNEQIEAWISDAYDYGTATGNVAWAGIALVSLFEASGDSSYLQAAERLGQWVLTHTTATRGFTAGYAVVVQNNAWVMEKLLYTATEHCIDLFALFTRLYEKTGQQEYADAAQHANDFVNSEMWDENLGVFYTGTFSDGSGVNISVIPTDIQPWALLANNPVTLLNDLYNRGYYFAKNHCYLSDFSSPNFNLPLLGYDFSYIAATQLLDGIWPEGTAQMACGACLLADLDHREALLQTLRYMQTNGPRNDGKGIPSADHNGVSTGFSWEYHYLLHTGATSWFIFAEDKVNPYYNPKNKMPCTLSATNEPTALGKMHIFPNPGSGPLSIAIALPKTIHNCTISIHDLQGRSQQILSTESELKEGKHLFRFDVQELPAGIYACVFQSTSGTMAKKFVVLK